jgi:hypothetical protein
MRSLLFLLLAGLLTLPAPTLAQRPAIEEEILSPTGDFPAIDAGGQGGFVSVWAEILGPADPGQDIFASLVPPGGSSPGKPFQVNTQGAGPQVRPSVAAGPQGDFMVVWQGGTSEAPAGGDGDGPGVFGQAFSRTGARLGPERRLSEEITAPQTAPRVAALEGGSFVVVWEDGSTPRGEIVVRRFSAMGASLGPEQRLAVAGEHNLNPRVASYKGGFAVSWTEEKDNRCSNSQPNARRAVIARFDPSGRRTGKLLGIGRLTCKESAAIVALAGSRAGAVAVLRTSSGHSVQRLGPSGEVVGKPVPISRRLCQGIGEGFFCRYVRDVAMNDRGRFAVVWEIAGSPTVFYAQAYSPNVIAGANSVELAVVGSTSPNPAIALANDGTVAVALRRDTGIPEDAGLFLQRFRAP